LIFVVGAQKLVPSIDAGMKRLYDYVVAMEDEHMMQKYNAHTYPCKVVIFKRENPFIKRKVTLIIVNEKLGF
jgi:hypothetical protein